MPQAEKFRKRKDPKHNGDRAEARDPAPPEEEGKITEAAPEGAEDLRQKLNAPPGGGAFRATEADGALVAPPDFKSGREAETSPVGSIPARFRQSSSLEIHNILPPRGF
jgi:hypothetical protein